MKLSFLRDHWLAFCFAILAGLVVTIPALYGKLQFGIDFSNPVNIRFDDEFFYFSRIREVLDGHPTIGNAYLFEHKTKPPAPAFLSEYFLAQPLTLLKLDVVSGNILYDFLLPAIAFILTYSIFFVTTNRRWLALCSTAILFGFFIGDFARSVSPQFNFLFWLSQFFFLYRLCVEQEGRRYYIYLTAAVINFGLLFYLYAYYWTYYAIFLLVLALVYGALRNFRQVKLVGIVAIGGAVIAIPWGVMVLSMRRLPEYSETLRRLGMIDTHFPSGIAATLPLFFMVCVAVFLIRKRFIPWDIKTIFLLSTLVAALFAMNQHVVTGKNLEFSSHYFMLAMFCISFFSVYIFGLFFKKLTLYYYYGIIMCLIILLYFSIFSLLHSSSWFKKPADDKNFASSRALLAWLEAHTETDDVVYADQNLSHLIPIYTHDNVYFSNAARFFFLSDAELADRFIIAHYFETIDSDLIQQNIRSLFGVYYIDRAAHDIQENKVRSLFRIPLKPIGEAPSSLIAHVQGRAEEIHQEKFEIALKHYRVDYLVWDQLRDPERKFDSSTFLKKVYRDGRFTIYHVLK